MIVRIPKNQITISILGTFFCLAGFGALTQNHVAGSFIGEGAAALMFWSAIRNAEAGSEAQ